MAVPSSSCRTNPVSRNSELNNPMRRSFSGNPFAKPSVVNTPSPGSRGRQQSTEREGQASWRDLEDKENGKDPNTKPGRARSPAPSKPTKNFMSPTISAASKINPSPRKKILVERNEAARSSVSSKEENELKEEMNEGLLESTGGGDLVNLEPSFKTSPRVGSSSSVPLAPLDADPLIPPYDPKTNYLSPRPQFICYRPNPRMELYRGGESEQLAASLSDSDVTTEEAWSDDSQRDLGDLFSSEMEEEEEEKELLLSVPPSTTEGENVETKRTSKAGKFFFSGSKLAALLLVLALTLYSIAFTDIPAYQQVLKGFSSQGFQVPDGVTQLAKGKFDGLTQKVEQWSSDILSYTSQKIKWVVMHDQDPFSSQYANFSMFDFNLADGLLKFEQRVVALPPSMAEMQTKAGPAEEEDDDQLETAEDDEPIDEATEAGQDADDQLHDEVQGQGVKVEQQGENFEAAVKDHDTQPSEQLDQQTETESHAEMKKNVTEIAEIISASQIAVQLPPDFIQEKPSSEENTNNGVEIAAFEEAGFRPESTQLEASSIDFFMQEELSSAENTNNGVETAFEQAELRPEHTQLEASSVEEEAQGSQAAQGMFSAELVPVASSLGVLLLCAATAAAILLTKKRSSGSNSSAPEQVPAKKLDTSPISVAEQHHTSPERSCSRNWQTGGDLVDLVSQSGPSQTSSFQKSSKELEACSEAQSQERRVRNNYYKRESLASSEYSIGGGSPSHSYGSFTTYEKIPKKHGAEEEIVTPVRRSSRIKKQVTSPAS